MVTVLILYRMAGLGLFKQKSVRALAPRALLQSAYVFLCLIYYTQKGPGHRERAQGSFYLRPELHAKNVFWAPQWGFGGAAPYTKP
jgi:hypothetical protein